MDHRVGPVHGAAPSEEGSAAQRGAVTWDVEGSTRCGSFLDRVVAGLCPRVTLSLLAAKQREPIRKQTVPAVGLRSVRFARRARGRAARVAGGRPSGRITVVRLAGGIR
ncbi:hypothetical protein GCM10009590_28320 [Brachybacterium alimentarium]